MKEEFYPKKTSSFLRENIRFNFRSSSFSTGVTLIELLVVVAIIAILALAAFTGVARQLSKARDAQRKADMESLRVGFEDYYSDYDCYPTLDTLTSCGSEALSPYLKEVPCDPKDEEPYLYFSLNGGVCSGYKVLAQLENTTDPSIESIGCSEVYGCYYEDDPTYNFGISMGGTFSGSGWIYEAGPTPTPSPTPDPGDPTPTPDPGDPTPTPDPGDPTPTPTPIPTPTPTPTPSPPAGPGSWVISPDGTCAFYTEEYLPTAGCPATYETFDACFAVSGCSSSCTEDDVPLFLRCER